MTEEYQTKVYYFRNHSNEWFYTIKQKRIMEKNANYIFVSDKMINFRIDCQKMPTTNIPCNNLYFQKLHLVKLENAENLKKIGWKPIDGPQNGTHYYETSELPFWVKAKFFAQRHWEYIVNFVPIMMKTLLKK